MDASKLNRDTKVSYRLKINGRWTPHLRYVGETRTAYAFKACQPVKAIGVFETEETYVLQKPLPPEIREFFWCMLSGTWKRVPHTCRQDCPAQRDVGKRTAATRP